MIMKRFLTAVLLIGFLGACRNSSDSSANNADSTAANPAFDIPVLNYTIVNATAHDKDSYTEGFLVHDGQLYESSGAPEGLDNTRSVFGIVDPASGRIAVKAELDRKKYFGEGITILNNKIYQLTWKNEDKLLKKGFVYDLKTFKKIAEFDFPSNEGWGMTTDGQNLILSDGTSNLTYLDPVTFKTIRIVGVTDNNGPVSNINELEYINGKILANIYGTAYIIRIDANSGKVLGRADFTDLVRQVKTQNPGVDVMNGIAYDSVKNKIFVTGKLWPNIYEIRFNN